MLVCELAGSKGWQIQHQGSRSSDLLYLASGLKPTSSCCILHCYVLLDVLSLVLFVEAEHLTALSFSKTSTFLSGRLGAGIK